MILLFSMFAESRCTSPVFVLNRGGTQNHIDTAKWMIGRRKLKNSVVSFFGNGVSIFIFALFGETTWVAC